MSNGQSNHTISKQWETIRFFSGNVETLDNMGSLFKWVVDLEKHSDRRMVWACVGRPTAPVFPPFKAAAEYYWKHIVSNAAIEYGEFQGDLCCRQMMARALTKQYVTEFHSDNIIFVAGGKIGLKSISYLITKLFPHKKVVITVPFYPSYKYKPDSESYHDLIMIDTLDEPRLTAKLIARNLENFDSASIGAFILNDPNNPMGTVIGEEEWRRIALLLKRYSEALIVLDESYAEMVFDKQHISLLTVAPELKHRTVLLRSATKGFSASGERAAILAAWNDEYVRCIRDYHASLIIHAPRSLQYAYACAMEKLDEYYVKTLSDFYKSRVRWIENLLDNYGFRFTDRKIEGTFYVIADFSDFRGKQISVHTNGTFQYEKKIITRDIDVVFHIIMEYGLVFLPLSLLGTDPNRCLCRITCSISEEDMPFVEHQFLRMRSDLDAMTSSS